MEQKTKSTEAMQRTAKIKALCTEASDTVRHGWLAMLVMNVLTCLIPILIPAAFVVCAALLKLPLSAEMALPGLVCLFAGIALQSYFAMGFGAAVKAMADGREVRPCAAFSHMDDAGRVLCLFVLGLVLLLAAAVPGAAIAWIGSGLTGLWKPVVTALSFAVMAALLLTVKLSGCLSLFVMADDADCSAAVALLRSARLMKGHKRQLVRAVLPSLLLWVGLSAAMALLLWPLAVKRDLLTDTLMIAGGVAYLIGSSYIFMRAQAMLACLYTSIEK